ncbi:FAD-dependent oxidoreductase [uncultured Roseibium sp.]|uniref:FAD-dependent oxidoreductase n=1 Tax=uncultured Roseibium sp. TaxID=1936171 RepID=UPI0032168864
MTDASTTISRLPENAVFDVAVLGAGAAGMAAAVFAALKGASVILIENTEYLGGTTAYSAGTTWIPNTRHADPDDSPEKAKRYLDHAIGNRSSAAMRDVFLRNGPLAVKELESRTDLNFSARSLHPDYLYELDGSTSRGRALEPQPFDAGQLGKDLKLVRPPIPEFTILGGLMIDRDDISHLLNMTKSLKSFGYAFRLIGSFLLQKVRFGRGTRLVMGNAMIGRLLKSALDLGVTIATQTETEAFSGDENRIEGLVVRQGNVERKLTIRGGVILASGGFGRHSERRGKMLPQPVLDYSPAAPGHTGLLHDLALAKGAGYGTGAEQNVFWAPCSVRKRPDGTTAVFPHFVLDRSKPGTICVDKNGRRFTNESRSYHEFGVAMYAANENGSSIPTYLIADATALTKYGLGMVRPGGRGLRPFLEDDYLVRANTLEDLAENLDIDASALKQTVDRFNGFAETGVDEDFHRGETAYECVNGDASHKPNPTLGKLDKAPFYAVRLWPCDIGSATGLQTDEDCQVLAKSDRPIEGLYACGNDMQSVMGGVYPGPGITIGPAITFAYVAANHACERAKAGKTD